MYVWKYVSFIILSYNWKYWQSLKIVVRLEMGHSKILAEFKFCSGPNLVSQDRKVLYNNCLNLIWWFQPPTNCQIYNSPPIFSVIPYVYSQNYIEFTLAFTDSRKDLFLQGTRVSQKCFFPCETFSYYGKVFLLLLV